MSVMKHALSWRREGSLAIATTRVTMFELVHDLEQVDQAFEELDGLEHDESIDALLFVPAGDDPPDSTLRGLVESSQLEAQEARARGRLSLLRSFNILTRFAMRIVDFKKLVAVAWRDVVDPMYLGIGLTAGIRLAAEDVSFHVVNPELGMPPLGGIRYVLPQFLGIAKARSLFLSGEPLPAARALELGLVDAILPTESFAEAAVQATARLVRAHLDLLGQNRPIVCIDAHALREHLREEMRAVERVNEGSRQSRFPAH